MMNAQSPFSVIVGVDVSKDKLDVAFADGKETLSIDNSPQQIVSELLGRIKTPHSTLVVMEATGGYEELLVTQLQQHNIAVAVVNPRRVRAFAAGIGKDAKTDLIDAQVIAFYGQVVKPAAQAARSDDEKKLQALVERRRQLLDLINQENNRRQQTADPEIQEYIQQSLETLKNQVKTIDERLARCVQADTANARKVEILVSVHGVGPVAVSTILARGGKGVRNLYRYWFLTPFPPAFALHPRDAGVQMGRELACVQVPPRPLRRMVVARQLPLTVRTFPLHPRWMLHVDVHTTLVNVQLHFPHSPRSFQSQDLLVKFDISHRLALLRPAVLARIVPTEKPEGPDCKGCIAVKTRREANVNAVCLSLEVTLRSQYLRTRCDYLLPRSIARGSAIAEKGHQIQRGEKAAALALCATKSVDKSLSP